MSQPIISCPTHGKDKLVACLLLLAAAPLAAHEQQ